MVGTGSASRWNHLRTLMSIRHGPGAAVLPPSITRIHLEFARTTADGHMGPKKFWRDILPRLKYHNPAIPMIVNRRDDNAGDATMSIYYQNVKPSSGAEPITRVQPPSSAMDASKAAPPAADERVVKLDMKNRRSEDILAVFMAETRAQPVTPTPEELEEVRTVEDFHRQGDKDRIMVKARLDEVRKEAAMLAKAREAASTT